MRDKPDGWLSSWTEIVTENVGLVHLGDRAVMITLAEDVPLSEIQQVKDDYVRREMRRYHRRETARLRQELRERRQARERLREAGYGDDEILF